MKYLCDNFGLSLKHAKEITDHIADEMQDDVIKGITGNTLQTGTSRQRGFIVASIVSWMFAFIGIVFLGIGVIVYENNTDFVNKSVKIEDAVKKNYPGPFFEYEYQGQKYSYQTTAGSNPPPYYIDIY